MESGRGQRERSDLVIGWSLVTLEWFIQEVWGKNQTLRGWRVTGGEEIIANAIWELFTCLAPFETLNIFWFTWSSQQSSEETEAQRDWVPCRTSARRQHCWDCNSGALISQPSLAQSGKKARTREERKDKPFPPTLLLCRKAEGKWGDRAEAA